MLHQAAMYSVIAKCEYMNAILALLLLRMLLPPIATAPAAAAAGDGAAAAAGVAASGFVWCIRSCMDDHLL